MAMGKASYLGLTSGTPDAGSGGSPSVKAKYDPAVLAAMQAQL